VGEAGGFLKYPRESAPVRPAAERVRDWEEIQGVLDDEKARTQGARCMGCGTPFCHSACPLGNLAPEWNDLVYRGKWREAADRLHDTNNFPEITGRLCPAPCEGSCVLGANDDPVSVKAIEMAVAERAFTQGWVTPEPPAAQTGRSVGIVGSGPAGLAAAQQLTRAGHQVVVLERAQRAGGILRYGIPSYKLSKAVLDRRLSQMEAEGTRFRTDVVVGEDVETASIRGSFDALVLAGGSTRGRDLTVPGRQLSGVCLAMDYLTGANLAREAALPVGPISAEGKRVVVVGGGDTGADCVGTANRQGAVSVHNLEIMPQAPLVRAAANPWPDFPIISRTSSAHEEGCTRMFSVATDEFVDNGRGQLRALRAHSVNRVCAEGGLVFEDVAGSAFEIPCDLVVLALGFEGPARKGMLEQLKLALDERGNVARDSSWETSALGVYACGDMARGQSLIVWAIAEGRTVAAAVDRYLMGESLLPAPLGL